MKTVYTLSLSITSQSMFVPVYIDTLTDWVCLCCRYHLRDVVVGKIYFLLVRIKIKHMEIAIVKKETSGMRECITL